MCIIQFHLKFAYPVLSDLILNGTFHSQPKCKLHLENQVRRRCIQVNTGKSIGQSAYFRSLLDPLRRQGLRKRYQAVKAKCASPFSQCCRSLLLAFLVILASVIYTGLSEERVSNLAPGSIAFCQIRLARRRSDLSCLERLPQAAAVITIEYSLIHSSI